MTEFHQKTARFFLTTPSNMKALFYTSGPSRQHFSRLIKLDRLWYCGALLLALLLPRASTAAGTWTALVSSPPDGVNNCMLMSDGTVLGMNGSGDCAKLTPDIHGSYVNGTWSTLSSMNHSRLFFSSQLLTNGNLWVAGGEDGNGGSSSELYNSLNNTWALIPPPASGYSDFSDSISEILPNGNTLVPPVYQSTVCIIYNVSANNWQSAASCRASQDESDWVKLPNDNILTVDAFSQNSEHYIPSLNEWVADGTLPVPLFDPILGEIGTGHLLPNGKVFFIGSTTNTATYTPGVALTSAGTWVASSPMPNDLGAADAPAATMVNGKILCCLGPSETYNGPCSFYEYDYTVNTFIQVSAPGGGTSLANTAPFGTSMLDLPDGTVLFVDGQNGSTLYVYTPDGTPLAAGQPVINSITGNTDGSYTLTGTGLNGISEGAAYGDDEQMNGNYPLVRMTNTVSGNVYYARTFSWNSTSVQTGSRIVTTKFTLPQNLPAGTYSLVVTAVGNASAPQTFTYSPPAVPTGLTAAGGSNALVNVHWNPSAGASSYTVERALNSSGYFATIATVTATNYTDAPVTNGLIYYYKISAVGSGGPSGNSAAVSATPVGPPIIPGATSVNLASYYNRTGIYTDGRTFSTGLDGSGSAYSANLLGNNIFWNNLVFAFGPANAADVVACAGQTIPLIAGRFNTLEIVATGVDGSQLSQTFTVTYTDSSTATFTPSMSDWANSQNFPGEYTLLTMPYRNENNGSAQTLNVNVYGYSFTLDQTKTVKSVTLPNNSEVVLLSMNLANNTVAASLSSFYNRAGIYQDGVTFTNPATGGLDGGGEAYSGTMLGSYLTWTNTLFAFGPLNATDVISTAGQTIPLTPGNYSRLRMLATGVQGGQTSQSFIVTYGDATTATFVQSLSDWFTPGNYPGESQAYPMGHRNNSNGSPDNRPFYLYGYSFTLNSTKTVKSIRLPSDANVIVAAISLVPNWPPTFKVNPFTLANANAGSAYAGTIATNASDLNGDTLTYAEVSGPAWLTVAANGTLSGTPSNTNDNLNTFIVSVTDTGGMSNTATLYINVNGVPSFALNPFATPDATVGESYSATISTNAIAPNPGDTLTYALVSGPAWLTVGSDGTLSGTPLSSDAGTNSFEVSVTDPDGLSATAALNITVNSVAPFVSTFSAQPGSLLLSWAGGNGPYQVQWTTNLVNPVWQNLGGTITSNSLSVNPTNGAMYYRIIGQ